MEDASRAFISIPVLQAWVGNWMANVFRAESGLPTAGATNALILAAAACIMKGTELEDYDPLKPQTWRNIVQKLPKHTEGLKSEFIVQRNNRNSYDHAIECAGGTIIEAGSGTRATEEDLLESYSEDRTAAYYYTITASRDRLPINTVARIAHEMRVPLVVDAAPYLTHKEIPRKLLDLGADLVIFSGGKQLGGPNNTGILLGNRGLIKLAHLQSYPFDGVGRAAKMSRETILGLVKAIDIFMGRNDNVYYKKIEERTRSFSEKLNEIPGIKSGIIFEPMAIENLKGPCSAYLKLDEVTKIILKDLHTKLLEGDPVIESLYEPIFLIPNAKEMMTFKTEYLLKGDEEIILTTIRNIIKRYQ
jgi:L-seryl-tRNA(Ser) seleniumtransferase